MLGSRREPTGDRYAGQCWGHDVYRDVYTDVYRVGEAASRLLTKGDAGHAA